MCTSQGEEYVLRWGREGLAHATLSPVLLGREGGRMHKEHTGVACSKTGPKNLQVLIPLCSTFSFFFPFSSSLYFTKMDKKTPSECGTVWESDWYNQVRTVWEWSPI
jgi:hypothetical protein